MAVNSGDEVYMYSNVICTVMHHTGSGLVVLGQEQDQRGGGYSPQESFVGHMTLVNLWGEQLSAARVRHLYTQCERYVGTVRAWPDFKASVKGQITVSKDCR